MKLKLLHEFDGTLLARAMKQVLMKSSGITNNTPNLTDQSPTVSQPQRSGNIDTPTKPKFAKFMGQGNPHGTTLDKVDRPPSYESTRPEMTNLGQPFERGLSTDIVGDGLGIATSKGGTADVRARLEGPAEDPGRVRMGTFGIGSRSRP